jgi:hypothetical protein
MSIMYGQTIYCEFNENHDIDSFTFVGSAGDTPIISATYLGTGFFQLGARFYGPSGALIDEDSPTSYAEIEVQLPEDGIYTLVVQRVTETESTIDYRIDIPCITGKCATKAAPDTLGYNAVDPCRIVDTRYGIGGYMSAGEVRHFHTYGDISEQNSAAGGAPPDYPQECPFALGEHAAVHLNVTIVPLGPDGQGGFVTLWPHGGVQPTSSWVNYKAGVQNIANAGTVKTHSSDGATADISVFASRNIDLVIDVMGYYTE